MLRLPAKYVTGLRGVCDEVRRITGATALHVDTNVTLSHRPRYLDDLENRIALPVAEINRG
jgi:hypothetical protein